MAAEALTALTVQLSVEASTEQTAPALADTLSVSKAGLHVMGTGR